VCVCVCVCVFIPTLLILTVYGTLLRAVYLSGTKVYILLIDEEINCMVVLPFGKLD
jgi:hypothetical protein